MTDVPDEQRLVVREQGSIAELVYRVEDGRLVLVHTGVPDELGGRGIGGSLVRAALEKAEREKLTVVPWCPFARRWLQDHPQAAQSVPVDWESVREQ